MEPDYTALVLAIAELWPIALIVAATTLSIVFRAPLVQMLLRLSTLHAKRGDTEITIASGPPREIAPPKGTAKELPAPQDTGTTPKLLPEKAESKGDEDPVYDMLKAGFAGKRLDMDEAFERATKKANSDREKTKLGIMYEQLNAELFGDTSALEKLEKRAEDPAQAFMAYRAIGVIHAEAGSHARAVVAFRKAMASGRGDAPTGVDTALTNSLSESLLVLGEAEEAEAVLRDALASTAVHEDRRSLFAALAQLYEREKKHGARLAMLIAAVAEAPTESSTIFSAAYAASEYGFNGLATVLYEQISQMPSPGYIAQNNLAVQYARSGAPAHATRQYKVAIGDKQNQLPAANLAEIMLQAGLVDEAKQLIDKAAKSGIDEARLGEVAARLALVLPNEMERLKGVRVSAERDRIRFVTMAEALAGAPMAADAALATGGWETDGHPAQVLLENDRLTITWGILPLAEPKHRLSCTLVRGSVWSGEIAENEHRDNYTRTEFRKTGTATVVVSRAEMIVLEDSNVGNASLRVFVRP